MTESDPPPATTQRVHTAIRAPSLRRALDLALVGFDLRPEHGAAVALAKRLASDIDKTRDPDLTAKLVARYLPALEALGMTRTAAAGTPRGGAPDGPRSALDQLKERRARLRNATPVDPSASGS